MSREEIVLFSDGGGERGSSAAGACIIEHPGVSDRVHLLVFLGGGTNNEAEITAGLLGFSYIQLLLGTQAAPRALRWICDSEYTLKSATGYINAWQRNGWKTADKKPVKNRGLWEAYLSLSSGLKVTPEHVRGHSGHPENEACDSASTWARMNARELLSLAGGDKPIAVEIDETDWYLLDGQTFLEKLRSDTYCPDDFSILKEQLSALSQAAKSSKQKTTAKSKTPARANQDDGFSMLLSKLSQLELEAQQFSQAGGRAEKFAKALTKLRSQFEG